MLISMVVSGSSAGFAVELLAPWGLSSAILHSRRDEYTNQAPQNPQTTRMLRRPVQKSKLFARLPVSPTLTYGTSCSLLRVSVTPLEPRLDVSRAPTQGDPIALAPRRSGTEEIPGAAPRRKTQNTTQWKWKRDVDSAAPRTQRRSVAP